MTTGTIMGRRRVRSLTKRPRAERARRRSVSKSPAPVSADSSKAVSTAWRASSSRAPAPGDDLRAGEHLPRFGVDGDDHDDHALLRQYPPVTENALAHVAHDPVD